MKVQSLKTYHHVRLYHRSESSVPRTVRAGMVSVYVCVMSVEISLPSDIANSWDTITVGSDHRPWIESTENSLPTPNRYGDCSTCGDCTCEAARVACVMLNAKYAITYSQARAPVRRISRRTSGLDEKNSGMAVGYYGSG